MGRGMLAAACAALVSALSASSAFAAPATIRVDDDGVQCPTAAYSTIQEAVDNASTGDKILVCAGEYNETVTVDKRLTISAKTVHPDVKKCSDDPSDPKPNKYTYVTGDGGPAFVLNASRITLENFVVENTDGAGIETRPGFGGYTIRFNLIQNNVFGIYLHSNNTKSQVLSNCIRDNNEPGSAEGNGIYSDQGLLSTTIQSNQILNHVSGGILVTSDGVGVTPDKLTVKGNILLDNDEGLGFFALTNSTIQSNIIRGAGNRGIFIGPLSKNVTIKSNIIQSGDGDGIRFRNREDDFGYDAGSDGYDSRSEAIKVQSNVIQNMGGIGIWVEGESEDPDLRYHGPSLWKSTFERNIVQGSGKDGMKIEGDMYSLTGGGGNEQNIVRNNIFQASGGAHDCHDGTLDGSFLVDEGGGIFSADDPGADPLNTWQRNIGRTQNRDGLCLNAQTVAPFEHNDLD